MGNFADCWGYYLRLIRQSPTQRSHFRGSVSVIGAIWNSLYFKNTILQWNRQNNVHPLDHHWRVVGHRNHYCYSCNQVQKGWIVYTGFPDRLHGLFLDCYWIKNSEFCNILVHHCHRNNNYDGVYVQARWHHGDHTDFNSRGHPVYSGIEFYCWWLADVSGFG